MTGSTDNTGVHGAGARERHDSGHDADLTTAKVSAVRLPTGLLYWGVLPPGFRRQGHQAQDFRFEAGVPVPVETLHLTRTTLPSGAMAMIGIEPERLRQHLAGRTDLDPQCWSLVPDAAPPHLANRVDGAAVDRLNLLHGPFEPQPRRRLRLVTATVIHLLLAAAAVLVLAGAERRRAQLLIQVATIRSQADTALEAALPAGRGAKPAVLRLREEMNRLDAAAKAPQAAETDLAAIMQEWWRHWLPDLRVQLDVVTATPERLVIRGRVPSLADATRLAESCTEVVAAGARYRAEPLQAQAEPGAANFVITLARVKSLPGSPASSPGAAVSVSTPTIPPSGAP